MMECLKVASRDDNSGIYLLPEQKDLISVPGNFGYPAARLNQDMLNYMILS
jgi:hypothetical protein